MEVRASAEDYLESILVIGRDKGNVRAVDIAKHMGFSKPTISIALKQLRENGYVLVDASHNITLTGLGTQIALRTFSRHTLIANFLMAIGVESKTALADACRLEHAISQESFEALERYYLEARF